MSVIIGSNVTKAKVKDELIKLGLDEKLAKKVMSTLSRTEVRRADGIDDIPLAAKNLSELGFKDKKLANLLITLGERSGPEFGAEFAKRMIELKDYYKKGSKTLEDAILEFIKSGDVDLFSVVIDNKKEWLELNGCNPENRYSFPLQFSSHRSLPLVGSISVKTYLTRAAEYNARTGEKSFGANEAKYAGVLPVNIINVIFDNMDKFRLAIEADDLFWIFCSPFTFSGYKSSPERIVAFADQMHNFAHIKISGYDLSSNFRDKADLSVDRIAQYGAWVYAHKDELLKVDKKERIKLLDKIFEEKIKSEINHQEIRIKLKEFGVNHSLQDKLIVAIEEAKHPQSVLDVVEIAPQLHKAGYSGEELINLLIRLIDSQSRFILGLGKILPSLKNDFGFDKELLNKTIELCISNGRLGILPYMVEDKESALKLLKEDPENLYENASYVFEYRFFYSSPESQKYAIKACAEKIEYFDLGTISTGVYRGSFSDLPLANLEAIFNNAEKFTQVLGKDGFNGMLVLWDLYDPYNASPEKINALADMTLSFKEAKLASAFGYYIVKFIHNDLEEIKLLGSLAKTHKNELVGIKNERARFNKLDEIYQEQKKTPSDEINAGKAHEIAKNSAQR